MTSLALATLVVAFIYASLMILLVIGWHRVKKCSHCNSNKEANIFTSVVIAARNEERNIATCLNDILQQDFPSGQYEIIIVDDFSTDATVEMVKRIATQSKNVALVRLADNPTVTGGKKAAIAAGIETAKGELIITTDADCRYGQHWLSALVDHYRNSQPLMISGPVFFTSPKGLSGKFMVLEFISLVAAGAGAIGLGKPIMCNGANLAFRRDVYFMEGITSPGKGISSGDDVFLMHSITRRFGNQSVQFLKCNDAVVKTPAPLSLPDFMMQRIRWGSKTLAYPGSYTAIVAFTVYLTALLLLISSLALPFNQGMLAPVLTAWCVKIVSDFLLLFPACNFFGEKRLLWLLPLFEPLHLIYITFGGALSLFPRYVWKGRKHKLTQQA